MSDPLDAQETRELDFSDPSPDDADSLARDRVPIRSLVAGDLDAIVRIDRHITGRDRTAYFRRKVAEALEESGVRVSLVAEIDDLPVGFVMARVDFGEFGRAEPVAVMDTIGVDPGFAHRGVGMALMSQLLANLGVLRVERVRTEIDWNDIDLLCFLDRCGFRPAQRLSFRKAIG